MKYRSLGRTGVQVSPLCLGTMMFGGASDEEASHAMLDLAVERGVNFIDTANVYNAGAAEEVIGRWFEARKARESLVLATKFHGPMSNDPNARGNHRRHIIEACDASLRRLRTDWIDLYQVHRPTSAVPIDETLRALDDLVRAGKVRYVGTSTYAAWQIMESLWVSRELGLNRFVSEQPPYHLLDRRVERELLPMARTYGVAILPWSPLAGGFLSGKYSRDGGGSDVGRFDREKNRGGVHFSDAAFDVVDALRKIGRRHKATPSQVALAWCASRPGVTSPIVGPRTVEQLEDNLGAIDVALDKEDHAAIDAVAPPGRAIAPYYQADFGPHRHAW